MIWIAISRKLIEPRCQRTYFSTKLKKNQILLRQPFSAWENEETRRVTDVERLAEESLLSAGKLAIYVRASSEALHSSMPIFRLFRKNQPLFQRSRCKDTNLFFGTVAICRDLSRFVTFFLKYLLHISKKISNFAALNNLHEIS